MPSIERRRSPFWTSGVEWSIWLELLGRPNSLRVYGNLRGSALQNDSKHATQRFSRAPQQLIAHRECR